MDIQAAIERWDDLSKMKLLPPELRKAIWDISSSNFLWYCSILDLASEFASPLFVPKQHKQPSIPVTNITAWDRGSQPVEKDSSDKPIIRLTIDSQGLRCIERLTESPSWSSTRSDDLMYVVEAAERFSGVVVEFEVSLL